MRFPSTSDYRAVPLLRRWLQLMFPTPSAGLPGNRFGTEAPTLKHDTEMLGKFKDLKATLGLPLWQVKGLLESLWHYTAINTPEGDIGRHSNERICRSIEYAGDADAMFDALVQHGWMDESDKYRLIVHDWNKHAPEFIKKRVGRSKMDIVQTCPDKSPPIGPDKSGITQPNPTQPNRTKPKVSADAENKKSAKKKRQPDPIWDTVVALWFPSGVTGQETRVGLATKRFKGVGATPATLKARHAAYKEHWPGIDCTPEALFKHWDQVGGTQKPKRQARYLERHCVKCKKNFDTTSAICHSCCDELRPGWIDWRPDPKPKQGPCDE